MVKLDLCFNRFHHNVARLLEQIVGVTKEGMPLGRRRGVHDCDVAEHPQQIHQGDADKAA